jgi:GWxTD domain-containing protein
MHRRYYSILFLLITFPLLAQVELREKHYQYDPKAEIKFDYRLATHLNEAALFFKISLNKTTSVGEYLIKYTYYTQIEDQTSTTSDTIKVRSSLIAMEKDNYYFKISIPFDNPITLIVVSFTNITNSKVFDFHIPVSTPTTFKKGDLVLMEKDRDVPLFRKFLNAKDSFRIVSVFQTSPEAYFFHYKGSFSPATPPFIMRSSDTAHRLEIDSTFTVPTGQVISFSRNGLYFIQSDTVGLKGISMNITDIYFPKTSEISKLIERVIYLSTSKEHKILQEAGTKKAFEAFWISVAKNQDRARRIIGSYYKRVNESNQLFSHYKEGWMSDQGMIYIIYGPPNQIVRDINGEIWIYQKTPNLAKIKFSFVRLRNIFTDRHYELLRDEEYSQAWFRTIDLWRRGIQIN